jgi:hypothetical protein
MPTGLMLISGPSASTREFGLCHVRPTAFPRKSRAAAYAFGTAKEVEIEVDWDPSVDRY